MIVASQIVARDYRKNSHAQAQLCAIKRHVVTRIGREVTLAGHYQAIPPCRGQEPAPPSAA